MEEIRNMAQELLALSNTIQDKLNDISELEDDVEKLQVYRNERGNQLLHRLMDKQPVMENRHE